MLTIQQPRQTFLIPWKLHGVGVRRGIAASTARRSSARVNRSTLKASHAILAPSTRLTMTVRVRSAKSSSQLE